MIYKIEWRGINKRPLRLFASHVSIYKNYSFKQLKPSVTNANFNLIAIIAKGIATKTQIIADKSNMIETTSIPKTES